MKLIYRPGKSIELQCDRCTEAEVFELVEFFKRGAKEISPVILATLKTAERLIGKNAQPLEIEVPGTFICTAEHAD